MSSSEEARLVYLAELEAEETAWEAQQRKLDFATKQSQLVRARVDYRAFTGLVLKDEVSGIPLQLAPIHIQWIDHIDYCWARGLRCCILAPFGHGKCSYHNSLIQLADGSVRTHGELVNTDFDVLAFDEKTLTYHPARARCQSNGVHALRQLTTWSGRTLTVTPNHPVWTPTGWQEVGTLQVNDFIAGVRQMPELGQQLPRPGEAALLGYFVGDGCALNRVAAVTSADAATIVDMRQCATQLGFTSTVKPAWRGIASTVAFQQGIRPWLRQHGVADKGAYEKRIPDAIWTATNTHIAEFLAAYFSCDGTVNPLRGGCAEFYSVSKLLLRDTQSLLLRFGILSRLRQKNGRYKGLPHISWRLMITGAENLGRFRAAIHPVGAKQDALNALDLAPKMEKQADGRQPHRASENFDVIPLAYRALLLKSAHWHKVHTGVSLDQQSKHGTSRAVIQQVAEVENNDALRRLCNDNIIWDRVVDIVDLEPEETFAVEVSGYHTYISEDLITHNTALVGIGIPLFAFGRNPKVRIKFVCATDEIAQQRIGAIKNYIENDEDYHEVFPQVKPADGEKWTNHQLFLRRPTMAKDPSIDAKGIDSSIMGSRADLVIFDDVNDRKNSIEQPARREKIWGNFRSVFMSRLEPTARVVYIGTRWHEKDIVGTLLEDEKMRAQWGFLVQRISEDLTGIDCEFYYPDGLGRERITGDLDRLFQQYEDGVYAPEKEG